MFILQAYWYFDEVTGEFFYRIDSPAQALSENEGVDVVNMHIFHPFFADMALQADLLILHLVPDQEMWTLIELRRQMGKKTIFEIADNVLQTGSWVKDNDALRNPLVVQHLLRHADACDGIQYSTIEVSKAFHFLEKDPLVFENQVNDFADVWPDTECIRIGWGGSIGHKDDLLEVLPILARILERHELVEIHAMGHLPMLESVFGSLPTDRVVLTEAGPLKSYLSWLQGLHIGIAPLSDTAFNRGRSDVKFLEYASQRVAPVLSAVGPYLVHARDGENARLFDSHEAMEAVLEDLIADKTALSQLAARAYAYARNGRTMSAEAKRRLGDYAHLIGGLPTTTAPEALPNCQNLVKLLRAALFHYDSGDYESCFHSADKVLNMFPSYQLAHLVRLRALVALGLCEQALQVYQGYRSHPVYEGLFADAKAEAAKRLGRADWAEGLKQVVDPYLRYRLEEGNDRALSLARFEANPFCYESLVYLKRHLSGLDDDMAEAVTKYAAIYNL